MKGARSTIFITNKQKKREALIQLRQWINDMNANNEVPRLVDIWAHVVDNTNWPLTLREVKKEIRLHNNYMMNMPQQRNRGRSRTYRPITMTNLGHWHADVGFFSINKRYATPPTYRAGFLIARDVVSRYIYAVPLKKNRTADSMISAFKELFNQHNEHLPHVPIKSISFDMETSVLSNKVQEYFNNRGISFHAFKLSSSKAKAAENAIKQVRSAMAVLMRQNRPKDRWWNLLEDVRKTLNRRKIVIDGKKVGYAPDEINQENLADFLEKLYKVIPAYFWAQIDIDPKLVDFKYPVGTLVRVKLIATTSAVIGVKRSEINLSDEIFEIEKQIPFITRKMTIGKAYTCRGLESDNVEVLEEDIIVEAKKEDLDMYPQLDHLPLDYSDEE